MPLEILPEILVPHNLHRQLMKFLKPRWRPRAAVDLGAWMGRTIVLAFDRPAHAAIADASLLGPSTRVTAPRRTHQEVAARGPMRPRSSPCTLS